MPISPAALKFYLSGGASNDNPLLSLGGARSSTATVPTGLFDTVTGAESATGDVEYRCMYFRNEDADVDGLINPKVYISSNTPSATTGMAIGIDPAGKNASATVITDEGTPPAGVAFSAPSSADTGLELPGTPYTENDFVAIWVRRTVNAGTASAASDPATITITGDMT